MRLPSPTLKVQILFAFSLMAAPLLMLSYFIFSSHTTFMGAMNGTQSRQQLLALTSNVQRDIMDLQRNVLIYKTSASKSAVNKVNALYLSINRDIEKISQLELHENYSPPITSIAQHLKDYKSNFDVVVESRQQRDDLANHHLEQNLAQILEKISGYKKSDILFTEEINHLLTAKTSSTAYLATGDAKHISSFKKQISHARGDLKKLGNFSEEAKAFQENLDLYENNFQKIVRLTRNYTYLINVVMAGSAQEILYQASELSELSRTDSRATYLEAKIQLERSLNLALAFSLLGLGIAIFVPLYFFQIITMPIKAITSVFNELAAGNTVSTIPGSERVDEIGSLAAAANVFKAKNEQTTELLYQTEQSYETEQRLNAQLTEEKNRSEKSLSVKTEFLANMSHELRTPLNSVIGFTVRLLKTSDNLNHRQIRSLESIERNGKHLLAMINDVLDFSKIEAQKLELKLQEVNITSLCTVLTDQMRADCEEKNLTLIFNTSPEEIVAISDPNRLTQVLMNLLSNAMKYTNEGRITVDLRLTEDKSRAEIAISDTGIGITEENMTKLFKRFEQFDQNSRFKVGHGTGLGLSIVAKLSELLDAKIDVASKYGSGSRFSLTLPLTGPAPAIPPAAPTTATPSITSKTAYASAPVKTSSASSKTEGTTGK